MMGTIEGKYEGALQEQFIKDLWSYFFPTHALKLKAKELLASKLGNLFVMQYTSKVNELS